MKDQYGRGKVKYWRWTNGRQGSGYKIFYMWNWLFDFLLIRYPVGSYINWHKDPVPPPLKHYRINWVFKKSKEGGVFCRKFMDGNLVNIEESNNRLNFFRPDIEPHMVTEVKGSERWVLSIGWCTK